MKLWEIFRYETRYQLRRPWTWIAFVILVIIPFLITREGIIPVTLPQDFILNSPFIIASVTVISCLAWLLVCAPIGGEAGARDLQTRMHPLVYTTHITTLQYLGGRFLGSFALNAFLLSAVQIGSLLAVYGGGISPSIIGPFRPAAYLAAYAMIALPNAFIATTFQFTTALFTGRSLTAYFGSVLLLFFTFPVPLIIYFALGRPDIAQMIDPVGMLSIMNQMMLNWTIAEKNVRMFSLEGTMITNRLIWTGVALLTLALSYTRFRFSHRAPADPLLWLNKRFSKIRRQSQQQKEEPIEYVVADPSSYRSFGITSRLQQLLEISLSSFWMILKSAAGVFLLIIFPSFAAFVLVVQSQQWGISLEPWTGYILSKNITAPITHASDFRIIVPILIIYLAGELVWRERDSGISDNIDVTPVSNATFFVGKLIGLSLSLFALMFSLTIAGIVAQLVLGFNAIQPSLYFKILFGLQLPEYILFAALCLAVQVIANQKHIGMLITFFMYLVILTSPLIGVHHHLLIFGAGPLWSFTEIRGFGSSIGPWLMFKVYWGACIIFISLGATLLWVRGRNLQWSYRIKAVPAEMNKRHRVVLLGSILIMMLSGLFIFYNTNILNEYITPDESTKRSAEYEHHYGKYEGKAQPTKTHSQLYIDIFPETESALITGSYILKNLTSESISSIHIETVNRVETNLAFDRPTKLVLNDKMLNHHIYELEEPLLPNDSMTLKFNVKLESHGFTNQGKSTPVFGNGTHFTNEVLPVIGYQPGRELMGADDRRKYNLPRQLTLPPPGDIDPFQAAIPPATFDAVIVTNPGQIAVAPGELRRTWTEGNRQCYQYVSDIPLHGQQLFFSANYELYRERWMGVDIQVFVYPGHHKIRERMLRSVRASLEYFSKEFGPYPYSFLQVIEQPGNFFGMGVDGSGVVTAGEGFFRLDPKHEGFDAVFEITAHEMGHQWWGVQLKPAFAEGAGVLSEGLAWYSAMQLVKKEKGREALRRFMSFMREPNPWPQIRTGLPLLRAMDPWANYRKGPYAMHALSQYVGEERVNNALKTLLAHKNNSLATTLQFYEELKKATPDTLKPLLHDLFEVNAFWSFDTKSATMRKVDDSEWEVTLELFARKTIADSGGAEKEHPVDEWIELGLFGESLHGGNGSKVLYLKKHFIRSGSQTVVLRVSEKPLRAGIDPYNLLDWEEGDNIEKIEMEQ